MKTKIKKKKILLYSIIILGFCLIIYYNADFFIQIFSSHVSYFQKIEFSNKVTDLIFSQKSITIPIEFKEYWSNIFYKYNYSESEKIEKLFSYFKDYKTDQNKEIDFEFFLKEIYPTLKKYFIEK